uniref:Uncharacterized protein n=1 Tax=Arion vulgaris TaxID=1028688 RepID=A0A0B6ZXS6_9EUPU
MNRFGNQPAGCCGETIVNFSLLTMPDKSYLNLSDCYLWCTAVVIFAEPYFKSVVGVQEKHNAFFSKLFGQSLAFLTYVMMSYVYSAWAFVFFKTAVSAQPRVVELQKNEIQFMGYLFVMAGLGVKIYTYITTSITTIMGGHYFKLRTAVKDADLVHLDTYYHPLGTSSVSCYLGFSLIQGSIAGLLLTVTLTLAYYLSFHLERYLLLNISFSPAVNSIKTSITNNHVSFISEHERLK